ncbi:coiled-coil domain-containing protein mad1 [Serendipita sp. 400]|nr:coiled-coil domain-containing protein mad1 [Serendipita sp. 400]
MDKRPATRLPARSRLPTASSSIAVPTASSSTASKRSAGTAQLDAEIEHALSRKREKVEAFSASMTRNSLERRVAEADQAKRSLEADLLKLKQEKEKVERDRRWFAEREKSINEEREEERTTFESEKRELVAELRDLRSQYQALQQDYDSLSDSHDAMHQAAMKANRISEEAQNQLTSMQNDLEHQHAETAKYQKQLHQKTEEFEALQQRSKSEAASGPRNSEDLRFLREQLLSQTAKTRELEDSNAKMKAELLVLRERNTNIEILREEKRVLERKSRDADAMREQLGTLEAEVDALRREREAHISHAQRASDVPVGIMQELATLRIQHANLTGQHQALVATVAAREDELSRSEKSLGAVKDELSSLRFRLQASEAAAARSENRAKVAQQEVDSLNSLLERFTSQEVDEEHDELDEPTQRTNMRIEALESLIDELKAANEVLTREMNELGGDTAELLGGPGDISITALKQALVQERDLHTSARKSLAAAQKEVQDLKRQVDKLDEDLYRLRCDIGTGRHVPSGTRVLEMADNPAARWFGKREEDVQRLKKENEALRAMVGGDATNPFTMSAAASNDGHVPKETLDVLRQEKEELEVTIKEKEKRLLRLQQIFSLKAEEFKTTVTSLLGWKFRFQQNGAVQLTSVYNPNALIVFSQPTKKSKKAGPLEGDDIRVQLIADTCPPEVTELYRTWVVGYGCVPGFLGSLSVQLFEASPEGAAKLKGT